MKSLNYKILKNLIINNYEFCVETGTFMAESTIKLAKIFDKVYTIELDKNLYELSKEKCKNFINITTMLGNSSDLIENLITEINSKDGKTLFYLDAHWSGDKSVNWEKSSWKGYDQNTFVSTKDDNNSTIFTSASPLDKINAINTNHKNECIIYIDDFQNFNIFTLKGLKNIVLKVKISHMNFSKLQLTNSSYQN